MNTNDIPKDLPSVEDLDISDEEIEKHDRERKAQLLDSAFRRFNRLRLGCEMLKAPREVLDEEKRLILHAVLDLTPAELNDVLTKAYRKVYPVPILSEEERDKARPFAQDRSS